MPDYAIPSGLVEGVERIVVASVGLTARAVNEVAPDLTLAQWRVLVLADRPDGTPVGSIASGLDAKIAATSRLIGRLQRRNLVKTQRADYDARVVLVSLTPSGEELRTRIVERRRTDIVAALSNSAHTAAAERMFDRLAAALETSAP